MTAADTIAPVHQPSARSDAAYAPHVDPSSVASKTAKTSCGWRPAPGGLVSLWDMLRFYAHDFIELIRSLDKADNMLKSFAAGELAKMLDDAVQKIVKDTTAAGTPLSEDDLQAIRDKQTPNTCKVLWSALSFLIDQTEIAARSLSLTNAFPKIKRMRERFGNGPFDLHEIQAAFNDLGERVRDQMGEQTFFRVPSDRAKYYLEDKVLDQVVVDRFPRMKEEVDEARMCIAFDRYTAAVFHLMRVMELGVTHLAKRLRVPKAQVKDKAWGPILQAVNAKIARLRNSNPRKVLYSEASAHLDQVRAAWRNTVMHPKRTYTQAQAEEVLASVKTFINHLVEKLL
jgi:hypothetical protein